MPQVRALVLIYDIRGFTAATKRMDPTRIGTFATAAHEAILAQFRSYPPTFVKNLGDGHLLLWETGPEPDPALLSAVVAGAAGARAAFTAFVAGHAAAGERLPKHVGLGIAYGEVSKSDDYYGVALNLAARLQNLARPEGLALDGNVFEVVAKADARLKDEFQRARVRLKGLGSTTVFVKRPFSWARLLGKVGRVAAIVAVPVAYLALADAGLGLPGGEAVRRFVDEHDASVFRHAHDAGEIAAAADGLRRDLVKLLLGARMPEGWMASVLGPAPGEKYDVWGSSQEIGALIGDPRLSAAELRPFLDGLALAFRPPQFVRAKDGTPYGWLQHPGEPATEAEPLFWTITALARALGRPGLVPPERREEFLGYLSLAQDCARLHRSEQSPGGWNMFPDQVDREVHSPYSTLLALMALLEVRAAHLPWEGSEERRDRLLAATAAWFASTFVPTGAARGWRRTQDPLDKVSAGLSYQAYTMLLRAEAAAGIPVPPPILDAIPAELQGLAHVSLASSSEDAGEFAIEFHPHDAPRDAPMKGKEGINFLWHPWAVSAARLWLDRAARLGAPTLDRVRVRRTLGHLVVDLRQEALDAARGGYAFMAAETLYGLETIPPP